MASSWTCTIRFPCPSEPAEFLEWDRGLPSADTVIQQNGLITYAEKIWKKKKKDHQISVGGATFKNRCFILGNSVICCAGTLHCHQLANVYPHIYELFYIENPFSIRPVPSSYYWGGGVLSLCPVAAKAQWACSSF